jgi:hypothetical protein
MLVGFRIAARCLLVIIEGLVFCSRTIEDVIRCAGGGTRVAVGRRRLSGLVVCIAVKSLAADISAVIVVVCAGRVSVPAILVVGVTVVEGTAVRVVAIVVVNDGVIAPVGTPMVPAPAIAAVPADAEANSPKKRRAAKPDARIGIPAGPCQDGVAVDQPGIVSGNIYDLRVGGLNDDRRALRRNILLRRGLQIAAVCARWRMV